MESLEAFYSGMKEEQIKCSNAFVPSLLAVYDALVDDDDDVREVAANIVSKILGGCLIPLAAQKPFFSWLVNSFANKGCLLVTTLQRLTGCDGDAAESVKSQLTLAMQEDETLFVEEEQNLFSDEIRETRVWAEILLSAQDPSWKPVLKILSSWVIEGFKFMRSRINLQDDGPGGWTSNPKVFEICMRVILTGNALAAHYTLAKGSSPVEDVDEDVNEEAREKEKKSREEAEITRRAILGAAYQFYNTNSNQHLHGSLRAEIMVGINRSGKLLNSSPQVD